MAAYSPGGGKVSKPKNNDGAPDTPPSGGGGGGGGGGDKKVPNPDGRLGKPSTREHIEKVSAQLINMGYKIEYGGGVAKEEFIRGAGGSVKGSAYPDITASKITLDGKKVTVRVNTIDTWKDGVTPTKREARNADRIRELRPNDILILIPKPK